MDRRVKRGHDRGGCTATVPPLRPSRQRSLSPPSSRRTPGPIDGRRPTDSACWREPSVGPGVRRGDGACGCFCSLTGHISCAADTLLPSAHPRPRAAKRHREIGDGGSASGGAAERTPAHPLGPASPLRGGRNRSSRFREGGSAVRVSPPPESGSLCSPLSTSPQGGGWVRCVRRTCAHRG